MKRIGVVVNCGKDTAPDVLARLAKAAPAHGFDLVTTADAAKHLPGARTVAAEALGGEADVLLALGGDGTVLHAVRVLGGRDKPVLGVNLGSLGFLTSVTQENLEAALEALRRGAYTTILRSAADCEVRRDGRKAETYRALNDVVIGWGASSRINTLELAFDGEVVTSFTCDGLIVSTPTGSTGHSLSAGGPILHPGSTCFVVSPICPHTLSNRPLVVPDGITLTVRVVKTMKTLLLSVDGQEELDIGQGDCVEVRRSAQGIRFIHLPGYSYFSVLRQKLNWRGSAV